MLVSHDMRLTSQIANEIWIDHKTRGKYKGDILNFKMDIACPDGQPRRRKGGTQRRCYRQEKGGFEPTLKPPPKKELEVVALLLRN